MADSRGAERIRRRITTVAELLKGQGLEVLSFSDGAKALAALETQAVPADLVLTGGGQAALRRDGRDVNSVMLTSLDCRSLRRRWSRTRWARR